MTNAAHQRRESAIERATSETRITLRLALDGHGPSHIATGIGFFDHMLVAFARHGGLALEIAAAGDLEVDAHHTVEDVGITLGRAVAQALGDKAGITRFGHAYVPMDEALVRAVIDISGRGFLVWSVPFERATIGTMDTQLVAEFFKAFATNSGLTLHVHYLAGENAHHVAEACFKAVARALRMAVARDPADLTVPSTKGVL